MRYFTVIKAHIATCVDKDRCRDDLSSGRNAVFTAVHRVKPHLLNSIAVATGFSADPQGVLELG